MSPCKYARFCENPNLGHASYECYVSVSQTGLTLAPGALIQTETTFESSLDAVLAEVREVMVDRHRKYGPGNIAKHGELGLKVRLDDKWARLDNSDTDFADESVDDTITDVLGYSLIWKMWRKGTWPGQS